MGDVVDLMDRLGARVSAGARPSPVESLPRLCGLLDDLHTRAEREYLSVGSRLEEFSGRAAKISETALSAADIISGEEVRGSIGGIRDMIRTINGHLEESKGESERNLQSLERIMGFLDGVGRNLSDLKETARTLRMLGLTTRIQSTKTGSYRAGFMDLGEQISLLSKEIASITGDLTTEFGMLSDSVQSVHNKVRQLVEEQKRQVSRIIIGAVKVLDSLEALSMESMDEARRIVQGSVEIRERIAGVVVSMQYQDINSQALEKVRNALARLQSPDFGSSPGSVDIPGDDMVPPNILFARKCPSLARDLKGIRNKITESMDNVIGGLKFVVGHIDEMSLAASAVNRNSSIFLHDLGTGMSSVTVFLSEVMASSRVVSEKMGSFSGTVDSMSGFIGNIERISEDVEIIALNAGVKAAQTGTEALGMGVIARAIRKMAEESGVCRGSLLEGLDETARLAGEISDEIDTTARDKERQLDQMVRELGVLLDALRYRQEKVVSLLEWIDEEGKALSSEINGTVNAISIHLTTGAVIDEVSEELQMIAGHIPEGSPFPGSGEISVENPGTGTDEITAGGEIEYF